MSRRVRLIKRITIYQGRVIRLVRPVILPLQTAVERIHSGAICDAKTIIGVLFARRILLAASRKVL